MIEIFQALQDLETRRPEIKRSNVWHVEKIRHEEAGELLEVTSNEPTPEELPRMMSEGADVVLNVLSICVNSGISPEAFQMALLCKIQELGERPPEAFQRGIRMSQPIDIYSSEL